VEIKTSKQRDGTEQELVPIAQCMGGRIVNWLLP
jgi:hypothetical protein